MAFTNPNATRGTTATDGTGPFTLATAGITGFHRLQDKLAINDLFAGVIRHETEDQYQYGVFEYSDTNEITTFVVLGGSNGTDPVSFAPGTKYIVCGPVSLDNNPILDVKWFGAKGDGVADDTIAISNWLTAIGAGEVGYAPAGTYRFTSALSKATQRFCIIGDGPYQTVFLYDGENATNDIITIGDGSSQYSGIVLENFRIASDTTMSGGVGLHLRKIVRSMLSGVIIDGQDGNGNLYHGIRFNSADMVLFTDFEARAQQDGVQVNGLVGFEAKADVFMERFKIASCAVGIRCGGAFGGLCVGFGNIIACGSNVVIDTTLASEINREVFFNSTIIDFCSEHSIIIDQSLEGAMYVCFEGCWIASAAAGKHGIYIENANGARISITGGTIFNHGGDGVRVDDASALVLVDGNVIRNNGGFGINPNVANHNVHIGLNSFTGNASGEIYTANQPASLPTQGRTNILGTLTNDNAPSHHIGEVISSTVAAGSAVELTNGVIADVTSIELSAGDWDVSATLWFDLAETTQVVVFGGSISDTSETFETNGTPGTVVHRYSELSVLGDDIGFALGTRRIQLTGTTTVYLVTVCGFAAAAAGAYGHISARRAR